MNFKNVIFILCLIVLISCSKNRPDIKPFDSKFIFDIEDNDTFSRAKEVNSIDPIIGFFDKKNKGGDKDFYRVNLAFSGVSYKIILTGVPAIDSKLYFYTPNYSYLFGIDDNGKGEAEKVWEYYPTTGVIVISVESKAGYNDKVPYIINFIPNIDGSVNEVEPNNDKESAIPIRPGEEKKGFIIPKGDMDFYKIVFDDDKSYDFTINAKVFSPMDINFTVYNEKTGQSKYINNYSWSGMETLPYLNSKKGEYYIKISGNIKPDEVNRNPLYSLTIEKNESGALEKDTYFEQEDNDEIGYSTELLADSTAIGTFYPENDMDYYKFELTGAAISVDISLSRIRGIDPIIEIYDNNLKIIKKVDEGKIDQGEKGILNNLQRGKYYIRLFSKKKSLLIYRLFLNIRYN